MDIRFGYRTTRILASQIRQSLILSNLHNSRRANIFNFYSALKFRTQFSAQGKKRHNNSLRTPIPVESLPSSGHPKTLVCKRCWDDIFSTKDWEHVCLDVKSEGHHAYINYTASFRDIKQSANESCSFCSMLLGFIGPDIHVNELDARCTAYLAQTKFENSTPSGSNTWYLSLGAGLKDGHNRSWSLRVGAHTTEADPAAKLITARPIQRDVFSPTAQEQMRDWISECGEHHSCPLQSVTTLPTYVIDVAPDKNPDMPRVIASSGQKGIYAVLSYHWGTSLLHHQLNTKNMSQYMRGLDINSLPATVRDGIEVTKAIGLQYLWVDSLCIIQDLKDHKISELGRIADYYHNSIVAIVAASSTDVSHGFLQARHRLTHSDSCGMHALESWPIPFSTGNDCFGTIYLCCVPCELEHQEDAEPINKRAWALQEQLLPSRQLIFSSHTLQWRCHSSLGIRNLGNSSHYESTGDTDAESCSLRELSRLPHEPIEAFIRWQKLVDIYSRRDLSLETDKLPALSNIAALYGGFLGRYYAGIWEINLLWQLRWTTSRHEDLAVKLATQYRAPSWSWASVDGNVYTEYESDRSEQLDLFKENPPLCEAIHVETHLKDPKALYGEVTSGHLVLQGKLRHGWLIRSKRSLNGPRTVVWTTDEDSSLSTAQAKYDLWANNEEYLVREVTDNYVEEWIDGPNPWLGAQHDVLAEHAPMKVVCLPLFRDFGLLLQATADGHYKRVGFFERFDWKVDFEHQRIVDVKIM